MIEHLHPPGEGFLQARTLGRAESVGLDPVHQAGQHQIGLHESVFGLLCHGPRQVRRRNLGLAQVVASGLFQLQIKQAAQAQAHRADKQHRSLAQWNAFQGDAGGVVQVIKAWWQRAFP
ncbi:hypothetical protein D3C76_604580 [compost metagenome]